jgi:hypothetical protein
MEKLYANSTIVKGELLGAELEPGTFCSQNAQLPVQAEEAAREDSESATDSDTSAMPEGTF